MSNFFLEDLQKLVAMTFSKRLKYDYEKAGKLGKQRLQKQYYYVLSNLCINQVLTKFTSRHMYHLFCVRYINDIFFFFLG